MVNVIAIDVDTGVLLPYTMPDLFYLLNLFPFLSAISSLRFNDNSLCWPHPLDSCSLRPQLAVAPFFLFPTLVSLVEAVGTAISGCRKCQCSISKFLVFCLTADPFLRLIPVLAGRYEMFQVIFVGLQIMRSFNLFQNLPMPTFSNQRLTINLHLFVVLSFWSIIFEEIEGGYFNAAHRYNMQVLIFI